MKKLILPLLIPVFIACSTKIEYQDPTWYPFAPDENFEGSLIDLSDWLDKPAGVHGFLKMVGDDFEFEDGTAVKFWGVNICSQRPYSDSATIDQWVRQLAHYGVNGVRFHKFTQNGLSSNYSTVITPQKWQQFDYFQARLKEAGIYYGWSPIYGHKLRPGDKNRLLAYDEIDKADMGSHLSRSTIGLVNFAQDIQDIHIELIVNMLNHTNPSTGLRYAEDPALTFVELQNEDNIWFSTADRMMELCPTYKRLHQQKFCKWLKDKYGSQEKLTEIWGKEAFEWGREVRKENWNLEKCNITPVCNQGIYGYEFTKYSDMDKVMPRFLLDNARFLYEEQVEFYERFVAAIRETGYKGTIVGSCWQAGAGITHYYNLAADREVGYIDRHNYFGGGTGHSLVPGKMNNQSMLSSPGSGFLNTGRQQVADRPYAISEWMSLPPNEWIAEGPAIIGIYGMGLNDWDASYAFASDFPYFTKTIHTPGVYNVNAPSQLALYPAIAAMIYRNEVEEGELASVRNVNMEALNQGVVGFDERVKQDMDQKEFSGTTPNELFAVGKVILKYTETFQETDQAVFSGYWDTIKKTIRSNTGQLFWDYSERGFFTASTDYTSAFVGFTGGKELRAGNIKISSQTPFSIIIASSAEKNKKLDMCEKIIVTAIARAVNTGMEFNEDKTELTDTGNAPVMMEPVQFKISLDRKIKKVVILDHSGKPKGEAIDCNTKSFVADGAKYQAIYYELTF